MGKKNMDILLSNIMGEPSVRQQEEEVRQVAEVPLREEDSSPVISDVVSDDPWKHFSFICSIELADKVQAIAHKEGFTIRSLMEYMMRQGIASYEAKHGKVKKIKVKAVTEVM